MERHLIAGLEKQVGSVVTVSGKVASLRDHGKMVFVDVCDRSGTVQCFMSAKHHLFSEVCKVSPESAVTVTALVKERPDKTKTDDVNGSIECIIEELQVLAPAEELPFDLHADVTIDTKFDHRPLTLRRPKDQALFRIQAKILTAFRQYLTDADFVEFQAPCIVGGDAEGGAEVFSVDYFGTTASLATSPQLYKQILVGVFERVFCVGQVFRAEKHSTSRHLNEYTSLDFEMGYIDDHRDVMQVLEGCVRHIVESLERTASKECALLEATLPMLPDDTFPVMKLTEAQRILTEKYQMSCMGEPDLAPEHERMLCEYARETKNSDFLFVTHYPVEKRPMYVYEDEDDPGYTKSFDLLFRGVEISSGGQRIHRYDDLRKKIATKLPHCNPDETFGFYLQAFKYGMPPHGGMAVGLERLTAGIVGVANAKEAALFPRDRGRIDTRIRTEENST